MVATIWPCWKHTNGLSQWLFPDTLFQRACQGLTRDTRVPDVTNRSRIIKFFFVNFQIFRNKLYGPKYQWFFFSCSFPRFFRNRTEENDCTYKERRLALEGALCLEGTTSDSKLNGGRVGDTGMVCNLLYLIQVRIQGAPQAASPSRFPQKLKLTVKFLKLENITHPRPQILDPPPGIYFVDLVAKLPAQCPKLQ
jgi:hypothetical protein